MTNKLGIIDWGIGGRLLGFLRVYSVTATRRQPE